MEIAAVLLVTVDGAHQGSIVTIDTRVKGSDEETTIKL